MRHSAMLLALPFSLMSVMAHANPATPEGAAALTVTFQTYLGTVPGVVSVQPEGAVYGVKVDFAPLLVKLPGEGVEASISPLEFKLTDNGDGTWGVTEDQSISAALKVPGEIDLSLHISHLASSGTFDTDLATFSSTTVDASDISLTESMRDATVGMTKVSYQIGALHSESTAVANAIAGADLSATTLFSDLSETFDMPAMAEGEAPMTLTARAQSYASQANIDGMRPEALNRLLAFLVANPSPEAISAGWPALKTILSDGIPLFNHLQTRDKLLGMTVDTPLGVFGLAELGVAIEANGFVSDGMVREAFTLTGLTLPEGLAPVWAADLVPHDLSFDFKVAGFDPAAGARKALDMVDATQQGGMVEVPENELLNALLPKGTVDLTLAPGSVNAPAYALSYEGGMTAGMAAMPQGRATIGLTGIAAIREAVKSAPEDWGMQAAPVLAMAEAMAKKGANGALIWELETTPSGGLLVNGVDVDAMGGQ